MSDQQTPPEPNFGTQMKQYAQHLAQQTPEENRRLGAYQLQNLINQSMVTVLTLEALKAQGVEISANLNALATMLKMLGSSNGKMGIALGIGTLDVEAHFNELLNGQKPTGTAAPGEYQAKVIKTNEEPAAEEGELKSTKVIDASSRFAARQVRHIPHQTDDAPIVA